MSYGKFIGLVLAIAPLVFSGAVSASIQIKLNQESELLTARYRLGDIAVVSSQDSSLQYRLSALEVGKSPRPGYWGYVTRQQLGALIEQAFPGAYRRLEWSGAAKARITAGGVAFSGDGIMGVAHESLLTYLGQRYADFSVGITEAPEPIMLPYGRVEMSVKLPEQLQLKKRMSVWVDIKIDEELYQSIPVWFSLSVFADVLVAMEEMPRHSIPVVERFVREYRDITSLNGEPVAAAAELVGMRLKSRVRKDVLLSANMLEPLPLVAKGQKVTVYANAGTVTLKTTGVALHDGDMLHRVNIRHPHNSINYPAVVVGQGQVRVE